MHVYAINTLQTFVMYVKAFRKEKLYRTPPPIHYHVKEQPETSFFLTFSVNKRESISRICNICDFKSLCQYTKSLKIILSPSGINKPRTVHSYSVKKGVWWWW